MSLFVNVTDDATAAWSELRLHYAEGDYNANYLRAFEPWISSISSENLIQTHPKRNVLADWPLPDPMARNQIIPQAVFLLYMTYYEQVLREIHAIGGFQMELEDSSDSTEGRTVDPFAEYRRKK